MFFDTVIYIIRITTIIFARIPLLLFGHSVTTNGGVLLRTPPLFIDCSSRYLNIQNYYQDVMRLPEMDSPQTILFLEYTWRNIQIFSSCHIKFVSKCYFVGVDSHYVIRHCRIHHVVTIGEHKAFVIKT